MQASGGKTAAAVLIFLTGCAQSPDLFPYISQSAQINWGGGKSIFHDPISKICSKLDFSGVAWPSGFAPGDRIAFELALNVTGSFEGDDGWVNLTNNFDGEGLSMGLLNQTLGTGSLQPLLIEMRDKYSGPMRNIFGATRLQSLLGMLSQWESQKVLSAEFSLSKLDVPLFTTELNLNSTSRNDVSVQWAVGNLYNGSSFKAEWASELAALARSPQYVSLQMNAAESLHQMALSLLSSVGVHEVRAYLEMFDFAVQDGGIYGSDFTDYNNYLNSHPQMSDGDKLQEILELRLRHVRPEYVADVRARKQAIINGQGLVHGSRRNLEKEYCFDKLASYH